MKTILITGASSGIGKATAKQLYQAGHQLILAARRKDQIESLATSLGDRAMPFVCDVTDYQSVSNRIKEIISRFGRLDVLINNAGVGFFDKVADGNIEQWHQMVDVNVKGVLNCLHAALPHLLAVQGQVVNVASVAAHNVFVNSGIYCGTKHAVFAFSEAIRLELAGQLRVTTISPGAVNTAFVDNTTNPEMLKNYKEYFLTALDPAHVASEILRAVDAPEGVVISEVVIRPHRPTK